MVRFSLSPKITLRKKKTRKNSESKESNIRLKRRIGTGKADEGAEIRRQGIKQTQLVFILQIESEPLV